MMNGTYDKETEQEFVRYIDYTTFGYILDLTPI